MKYTKKALALFLALCMMIISVPLSANATEAETLNSEVIDAALFFSDLHTSQSDYKTEEIKAVMGGVKSSGLNFSTVTSVGDAFSSNEYVYSGNTSGITQSIKDGLGDSDLSVYYAWSDHDRGANIENYTGLLYGDENTEYYIYTISMSDMSSEERYGVASTFSEEKLTSFSKTIDNLDHNKPLFIVSHQPLHARRGDNQYAEQWYNVISEAAEKMDIAFFWGHNHTSETSVDRDAYYVAKDGSETMQIEGMNNSIVPNFTYLNAGYMNESQYNSSSTREYVATAVTIYDEKINYTLYDEDGVYSGNYSLNEDVVREFAETSESMEEYTLSSIEVTNIQKTNYLINQELDMTDVKVTATYTKDGSSDITKEIKFFDGVNVTDGYTLSGYDKTKVGKQTITVSYNDVYTTFEIQVFERIITAADNMVNIEVTTPGVTSVEVNIVESEMISAAVKNFLDNYVAYDIKPIGYNDGEKVTVTLPVPDNVTNPVVYYVSDDGNIIKNMNAVKTENGSTVSFETEHFSVYVVGEGTFTEALENEITTGGTSYEEKRSM